MTEHDLETIADIRWEFLGANGFSRTTPLPRDKVREWMGNEDLDVMGVLHRLIGEAKHRDHSVPPLEFDEYFEWMTRYFHGCICAYSDDALWEDHEWLVGMNATHAVVDWFMELWRDKSVDRKYLQRLKDWMARALQDCPALSHSLGAAIYDHLWWYRGVRRFFADWRNDPALQWMFPADTADLR